MEKYLCNDPHKISPNQLFGYDMVYFHALEKVVVGYLNRRKGIESTLHSRLGLL